MFFPGLWDKGPVPGAKAPGAAVVAGFLIFSSLLAAFVGDSHEKKEMVQMAKTTGTLEKAVGVIKAKHKVIIGIVGVVLCFVVAGIVVKTVQRAADYDEIIRQNDELQAQLSSTTTELAALDETRKRLEYSEGQVKLLKESTNALKEQVASLNAEKEELSSQLEELLNVEEIVPIVTRTTLEEQIVSLSELVTKKYMYRNASHKEESKTWLWGWTMPFSDASLLATYDGTITTSIDLKEVKFSVDESTKTITATLPHSRIFDHNIPQETINVLEQKDSLFNELTFNDYNQFIAAEKPVMEEIAVQRGLLTEADEEAKKIIETFLQTIPGMEAYTLKFSWAKQEVQKPLWP